MKSKILLTLVMLFSSCLVCPSLSASDTNDEPIPILIKKEEKTPPTGPRSRAPEICAYIEDRELNILLSNYTGTVTLSVMSEEQSDLYTTTTSIFTNRTIILPLDFLQDGTYTLSIILEEGKYFGEFSL